MDNLQSYLNWFVYLFRVKGNRKTWPKMNRILRHLVLSNIQYKRKTQNQSISASTELLVVRIFYINSLFFRFIRFHVNALIDF